MIQPNDDSQSAAPKAEDYYWCLHCERAFLKTDAIEHDTPFGKGLTCPYEGCDGTGLDFWEWSKVRMREDGTPRYPVIPEYDVVYPLYD